MSPAKLAAGKAAKATKIAAVVRAGGRTGAPPSFQSSLAVLARCPFSERLLPEDDHNVVGVECGSCGGSSRSSIHEPGS
jgi:hypothetical protein